MTVLKLKQGRWKIVFKLKVNCNIESITEGPQVKMTLTWGTACHPFGVGSPQPEVLCEHYQSWSLMTQSGWLFNYKAPRALPKSLWQQSEGPRLHSAQWSPGMAICSPARISSVTLFHTPCECITWGYSRFWRSRAWFCSPHPILFYLH